MLLNSAASTERISEKEELCGAACMISTKGNIIIKTRKLCFGLKSEISSPQ